MTATPCRSVRAAALCLALLLGPQTGHSTSFEYDDLGRLIRVTYDNGTIVNYEYDPAGNRKQYVVQGYDDAPINDSIATKGEGPNLLDITTWPTGSAPAGPATIAAFPTSSTYYNETRWARIAGPGQSGMITAMEAGQTVAENDNNGGGVNPTNAFALDETRAYEFSVYVRKHNVSTQSLYHGTNWVGSGSAYVKRADNTTAVMNPYFLAWSPGTQAAYLDPAKWYKIVAYVLPEGYPLQSLSNWGGVFDVATGTRVASVVSYRWNEERPSNNASARFFTYYNNTPPDTYTTYFYKPEVRLVKTSEVAPYTPVVPALSVSGSNAFEGESLSFAVNLSVATTVDVKVDYVASHPGGTDSASSNDYTAVSGTLVIPEGSAQGTINVPTTEDSQLEVEERVTLTISNPVRATISGASDEALILNDDGPPSFAINNATISEGGTLSFTVTKSGSTAFSHNVNYATANGSATTADYTAKSGTLTFGSTETTKNVTVATIEDSIYESNETVNVNLSAATGGATISDSPGVGTINNDDGGPSFSIDNTSVSEGGTLSFTVTKFGATAFSHNVNYATANGSATTADYTAKSGTLSFSTSETTKNVTVATVEDSTYENSETVNVNLSSATAGASISDSPGVGTITNDDSGPSFSVNNTSVTEGGTLVFTVSKSGSTAVTHNVNYATANGTASSNDYSARSGTLSFTSGQTSRTVSVPTTSDTNHEPNETVNLNLSSATAGATIADSQGVGTINNDDPPPNNPPNARNDSVSVSGFFGTTRANLVANDTDPDGHSLEIISLTQPSGNIATVSQVNSTTVDVIGTSDGETQFSYTISDGHGGTDVGWVTVTVTGAGGGFP